MCHASHKDRREGVLHYVNQLGIHIAYDPYLGFFWVFPGKILSFSQNFIFCFRETP